MIDDPISRNRFSAAAHFKTETSPVFWTDHQHNIGVTSADTYCDWYIVKGLEWRIRIPDFDKSKRYPPKVTRERFFEILQESYPDYFEWFLFNPEWL